MRQPWAGKKKLNRAAERKTLIQICGLIRALWNIAGYAMCRTAMRKKHTTNSCHKFLEHQLQLRPNLSIYNNNNNNNNNNNCCC